MNDLEKRLNKLEPHLFSKFQETRHEVTLLLGRYSSNFPTYTDHSANHTLEVFQIASELMSDEELDLLNGDELYILSMACLLHDVGMCIPEEKIKDISNSKEILLYRKSHPNLNVEEFIRDIHHELSHKFILEEWELLKIPSPKYAKAIGLVSEGHRKVDLGNFDVYETQYFAKSGKESVCLPYLACILRIADELDVTNSRTPKILTKYYLPNNDISIREWSKHIATSQRNYRDNEVIFEVNCSDQNIYAALQEQFDKIQTVINYCQKVIRSIPFIKGKQFTLTLSFVNVKYHFIGFHPKGIKFSFDVQNVVTAFIGEDLYKDKLTSLREAIQNSIDSCRYKSKVLKEIYEPYIKVLLTSELIQVEDNGSGMDEFIIENFFGRLASSFYEQEKIKNQFEAIGQFGVGVFSYFLLSEYIDIETKTSTNHALKFRFDKDPKSYFHFYDKTTRTEPGTTITMYLKGELIGKLSAEKIENYIKRIFRHIEIPIELNLLGNESIVEYQPYTIDSTKEIKGRLKLIHKNLLEIFDCKVKCIINDDLEGCCGVMISKDYLKAFSSLVAFFDDEEFETVRPSSQASQISFSQKGVFVNYYGSRTLNYMIGDINLKRKIRINIDRNEFSDNTQIQSYIHVFEYHILSELFSSLELLYKNDEERIKISNDFLGNFSHYRYVSHLPGNYLTLLTEHLCLRIFLGNDFKIIKLKNFIDSHKEFVIISDKEDAESIYKDLQLPIVIAEGKKYHGVWDELNMLFFTFLKYTDNYIAFISNRCYKVFRNDTGNKEEINIKRVCFLLELDIETLIHGKSKKLWFDIWEYKKEFEEQYHNSDKYINYNHPFIQYIILNYDTIISNTEYKKIVQSAFSYMIDLITEDDINYKSLKQLNAILNPLNKISPIIKFTKAHL